MWTGAPDRKTVLPSCLTMVQPAARKAPADREGNDMSSIMTNTSAMVALQTMKSINANMNKTQTEISTGKSEANAKDNYTVWITFAFDE